MRFTIVCIWLLCLVNLYQGVTITTVPSIIIQGQSASITCKGASIAIFISRNINIIECTLSQPVCSIRDGDEFNKYRNDYNITHNSTSLTVTITNVSRNRDGGVWRCTSISSATNYTVDVKVPVATITIINTNSLIFTDGQTTFITCKTGISYPPASITWSIGGNNINGGTTTNNTDGTTTSILQYTPDKTDHNKTLQCSATNGYGSTKSDSITLNIRFSPSVHIEPLTSPKTIKVGRSLLLVCIVDEANPSVSYTGFTWSKDGVTIPGQKSSIYRVESVERSHTGSYRCTGDNGVGTGTSTPVQVDVVSNSTQSTTQSTKIAEKDDSGGEFIKGLGTGVGISLAVVLLVVISIYFYKRYKTSQCQQHKQSEHYSDLNPATRSTTEESSPTYQELDAINISPSLSSSSTRPDQPSSSQPQDSSSSSTPGPLSADVKVYENMMNTAI